MHLYRLIFITLSFVLSVNVFAAKTDIYLSNNIYSEVPFSSQYIESGALIRNIPHKVVEALIPQLNNIYGLQLESRGEAHITVLRPPEAGGWYSDHKGVNFYIRTEELHQKYFSIMQKTKFRVVCIGKRVDSKNQKTVFYLVVNSPELFALRKEIQTELERRALFTGAKTSFDAEDYHPHITIGYVGGDVHGKSKGTETCLKNLNLVLK